MTEKIKFFRDLAIAIVGGSVAFWPHWIESAYHWVITAGSALTHSGSLSSFAEAGQQGLRLAAFVVSLVVVLDLFKRLARMKRRLHKVKTELAAKIAGAEVEAEEADAAYELRESEKALDRIEHQFRRSQEQDKIRILFAGVPGFYLKYVPKNGKETNSDAMLITLYGYRVIKNKNKVSFKELGESLYHAGCRSNSEFYNGPVDPRELLVFGKMEPYVECTELVDRALFGLTEEGAKVAREKALKLVEMLSA